MGPATAARPKCLNIVAGRPLLHWQLGALREAGLDRIAIVRGYLAEMLELKDCAVFENPRWSETNMVTTLCCADEWLHAGPCLVSYGDILYHADHVRALATAPGDIVITHDRLWQALWTERFQNPLADAETFRCASNGVLQEIGRQATSLHEIEGQYMGLFKITPSGWSRIRDFLDRLSGAERDRLDMTTLLSRLLAAGARIDTVPVEGRWCEVDSEKDRQLYESRLKGPEAWRHDWRRKAAA
jgi:choline kinase